MAFRVPTPDVSVVDLTFTAEKDTDFCGAEAEAGAEEKLAVMELCEANAYMKESRCCQSSTMAMAYPSCNSLGVSPYGDGGRCLSPFEVRYEVDTLKDY